MTRRGTIRRFWLGIMFWLQKPHDSVGTMTGSIDRISEIVRIAPDPLGSRALIYYAGREKPVLHGEDFRDVIRTVDRARLQYRRDTRLYKVFKNARERRRKFH
jgi:hypothetical protein